MTVIASTGIISGIDYAALINGLTALDSVQINALQSRMNNYNSQDTSLTSLAAEVTSLKVSSASFLSSSIFRATTATSANSNVITATSGIGTTAGNYNFNVQRLASASQAVTQGFSSSSTALGITGAMTIAIGGKELSDTADLQDLNGGAGVPRGSIKITDSAGDAGVIDLSDAVNMQDVVNTINSNTNVSVTASIQGDHLVLADNSGGTGTMTVKNAGSTTTATALGIAGTATSGTITGTSVTGLTSSSTLASLNDGAGVRTAATGSDFAITGSGGTFNVTLGTAKTIGDVVKAINTAGTADGVTAAVSSDGTGLTLTDSGGGTITVAAASGSMAAYDLGLTGNGTASTAGSLVGDRIASAATGPLLKDLNGGYSGTGDTEVQYGTISINSQSIDLSSVRTLSDAIAAINTNTQGVTASLDSDGTGIQLSSSGGSFTVADGTGNLANYLNIAGSSVATGDSNLISSGNLHEQYVSANTALSTLNAGAGVDLGTITIADGSGASSTVDLSKATTMGDVIKAINNAGIGVTASIDKTGSGLLLTNTAGTGTASVTNGSGDTTATDLGIAGSFTNNQMDGSSTVTVNVVSTDTLANIATKLNDANKNISASIVTDGSGTDPYRLNISAKKTGAAGRLVLDGSGVGMDLTQITDGQDASIIYGGSSTGTGGLTIASANNTITGLIPSMTLNLTGTGSTTVAVTSDTSKISDTVQTFVDSYNNVINSMNTDTAFNSSNTANNGILFGNSTVQMLQESLQGFISQTYSGYNSVTGWGSLGITMEEDGTLDFDSDTLTSLLDSDPNAVQNIFTTNKNAVAANLTTDPVTQAQPAKQGIGAVLSTLVTRFTDSTSGLLFTAGNALEAQVGLLQDQQNSLNVLLADKRNRLQTTFSNLETTISQLQSQGNAINSLSTSNG